MAETQTDPLRDREPPVPPVATDISESVAIVGSRSWRDVRKIRAYIQALPSGTHILSGGAEGADMLAQTEAKRCGFRVFVYAPDWKKYGRAAGAVRNEEIVKSADRVVAFWDGKSKGTRITIDLAKRYGKPCEIIRP